MISQLLPRKTEAHLAGPKFTGGFLSILLLLALLYSYVIDFLILNVSFH
ncbi:hypothetical protein [Peribacillus simplex]